MRGFFIQHIDALISIGFGIGLTVYSWVHRDRLQSSPKKIVRALPVLAPLLLVFEVLRLAFDSQPAFEWRRITTGDQRASAEFPCAASTSKATDSAQGVSIKRLTIDCNIPGFRILVEKDQGKSRSLMRVALAPSAIYRVIATSTDGFHDDPVITRFIDSFTIQ